MEQQTIKFFNRGFFLASVLVVGVLVFFVGQMAYQTRVLDQQNVNQITVSGQGKVYAKPDVALINLGVKTSGLTVASVTKANSEQMNAVIAAVKSLGIEDKDIQTQNYNLSPNYNYTQDKGRIFEGYILNQQIEVKVRDFTKIGDVLAKATDSGANLVNDLQFTIDDPEKFKEEARAKAIEKAKANAQNLAMQSGIILGKITNIYENYNSYYPVMYAKDSMGMGGAESAPAPMIEAGQQEISVTINLTYKIK